MLSVCLSIHVFVRLLLIFFVTQLGVHFFLMCFGVEFCYVVAATDAVPYVYSPVKNSPHEIFTPPASPWNLYLWCGIDKWQHPWTICDEMHSRLSCRWTNDKHMNEWLVAWHSGRTSSLWRRTFPVLHSTCSHPLMWVNRPGVHYRLAS